MTRFILPAMTMIAAVLVCLPGAPSALGRTGLAPSQGAHIDNPAIDMDGHLRFSLDAARHRSTRRLTEEQFLAMAAETGTVVLDARSREKFELLHVRGAINLSFPDITIESLARTIPDKGTRILIYCNNNFEKAEGPFPSKLPAVSLNLSTYITLFTYGYRNVHELGPLVDPASSRLTLVSSNAAR